jgi:hypothetical protein
MSFTFEPRLAKVARLGKRRRMLDQPSEHRD